MRVDAKKRGAKNVDAVRAMNGLIDVHRWPWRPSYSELVLLGRILERERAGVSARDHFRDLIEVTRSDFALMARRRVPVGLGGKLRLLELRVRRHPAVLVFARELEHPVVQRVEAR